MYLKSPLRMDAYVDEIANNFERAGSFRNLAALFPEIVTVQKGSYSPSENLGAELRSKR